MILHKLSLRKIAQHDKLDLDLQPGLTAIVGANQSGKSNIVRAMKLAVTGQSSRNLDRILQLGAEEGLIHLDLSVGEVDCTIERTIRATGSSSVKLSIGGTDYGEGTDHNVADGYDTFFNLVGTHPELLEEIVFSGQEGLGSFLSASPAVRKGALQSIFGTKVAEKARGLLLDELSAVTIEDLDGEQDRQRQQLGQQQKKLSEIAEELSEIQEIDSEERDRLQKLVASTETSTERKEELERKIRELEVAEKARSLQDERSELDQTEKSISEYEEYEAQLKGLMEKYEDQTTQRTDLNVLSNREKKLSIQLSHHSPRPDPESSAEELEEAKEKLEEEKRQMLRMEQLLSSLTDEEFEPLYPTPVTRGECPTCGTELDELPEDVSVEAYRALRKRHEKTRVELTKLEGAHMANRDQAREYDRVQGELSKVRGELAPLQKINFVSEQDFKDAKKAIEGLESLRSCRAVLRSQVDMARERYESEKARETELVEELESLELPDSEVYNQAQSTLKEMRRREESRQKLEGQREQCQESISQTKDQLKNLEEEIQSGQVKRTYRSILEQAREHLHRDNLPARAASSVVRAINDRLASCMDQFQLNFSGWLDPDDLSPYFVGTDSPEPMPYELMSGGQKTAFAICFYVALWELYLPNCSLLTLDEPTRYQDEDRKRSLMEFFDSVRGWCQQTGSQLLLPTHDERLANSADQVLRIGQ